MKENRYDDIEFFNQYKNMARSLGGLDAAGEWPGYHPIKSHDLMGTPI